MCKFEIPYEMPTALRYAWYLYYIPMLLLPTVSLYLAFYIRQPENYKLPERRCLLFFPALFLIGIVLTNDLHQLVFTFPEGRLGEAASYEVGVYGYGAMYYAIVAWDLGCLLAALLIILLRCRKIKNRKMLWMPFGAYGLSVVYGIAYYLNLPFWKIFSSDMTAALCLLFALIIESCIQCGLIPSNTGYAQLFAASTISAQITDQSGKCIYQSQDSECIAPEIVRQVVQCPIMLENGIRLSGKLILGGYVLWKENLSELQEIVRELEDRKEELKDANLIEEENLRTKREVEKLSVKNQLYDKIQKQTARQSKLLTEFIEAYSMEEDENKREKILGKIVVIGAYIKRRSNLIFIAEQTVKFPIRELELCFRETIKNLEWNHVEAGFSTALEEIRSEDAMQIYDFFEAVIEESLEDLSAFNVNLKRREARIIMSMSVECKTDLQEIARRYGAYAEQDFDGSWLLSFSVGDTTGNGKWSVEDDQFILSIEGEEMEGIIGKDIISFDNMLEMGVKVIFAKDGTDAMDPALYLTEEENAVIGEWAAESVEELLGDGPQTSMEGVNNINDALRLDFKSDRNVTVIYKGEEIGTFPWSVALGYCSIESENPSLTVMINDDGTLKVDYSDDDDYYTFHCVKSDSE